MSKSAYLEKILAAANKMNESSGGGNDEQDKFWKAETDKAGNGSAVIRFLPGKTEDDVPFVKLYNHGFKGATGKWYIEDCPTTIGGDCPVCAMNGEHVARFGKWDTMPESEKNIVRERKRKLGFIANVLVISDPKNPENEGKVFMFKFGKKIFDKITDAMQPSPEEMVEDDDGNLVPVEAINPFDIENGANFSLNIRRVEGFANFDKSKFMKVSKMKVDWDDIVDQVADLSVFNAPERFKGYSELETKLNRVLSATQVPASRKVEDVEEEDEPEVPAAPAKPAKGRKTAPKVEEDTDTDDMDYFKKLAGDRED